MLVVESHVLRGSLDTRDAAEFGPRNQPLVAAVIDTFRFRQSTELKPQRSPHRLF